MGFRQKFFRWLLVFVVIGIIIGAALSVWELHLNRYLELGLRSLAFQTFLKQVNRSVGCFILLFGMVIFLPLLIQSFVQKHNSLERFRIISLYYSAIVCCALCLVTGYLTNVYVLPFRLAPVSLATDAAIILVFIAAALILWRKRIFPQPSLNIFLTGEGRLLCSGAVAAWVFINMSSPLVKSSIRAPRPYNVVIMLVDALRADHLGCYGYPKQTSPFLDRWAQEVVFFRNCYSQESYTMASVASVFTSTYPNEHQVLYDYPTINYLDDSFLTMAEILKNNNYTTAAVVFNPHLGPQYNLNQGFDYYSWKEYIPGLNKLPLHDFYETALKIENKVRNFLEEKNDRPFFLYLHYRDVHGPFVPPSPYHEMFLPPGVEPQLDILYEKEHPHRQIVPPTVENNDLILSQYDGEIRYTDERLKDIFKLFFDNGINSSNTVFIFIADHGEEFVDIHPDGKINIGKHGRTLYREQLHVPLICSFPDIGSGSRIVDERVKLIDILPSVLESLGIGFDAFSFRGSSLIPLIEGKKNSDAVFTGGNHGRYSFIEGRWKYYRKWLRESLKGHLRRPDPGQLINYENELYDIITDPFETVNLALSFPDTVAMLARKAEALFLVGSVGRARREQKTRKIDSELREQLKSLGYVE